MRSWQNLILALATTALLLGMAGCASTDESMNEKPWNTPKTWETGMPSGMMQGR